jgi:spore coat protein U-like protein
VLTVRNTGAGESAVQVPLDKWTLAGQCFRLTAATVTTTGNGTRQMLPTCGRIFSGQTVSAVSDAGTLNVTVSH